MTLDQAVKIYGSQTALARALGVTRSAVTYWRKLGAIPALRQLQIEMQTAGRLRADQGARPPLLTMQLTGD